MNVQGIARVIAYGVRTTLGRRCLSGGNHRHGVTVCLSVARKAGRFWLVCMSGGGSLLAYGFFVFFLASRFHMSSRIVRARVGAWGVRRRLCIRALEDLSIV